MITLKCDNRVLTKSAKYSYLSDNYLSGRSSIVIDNATDFELDYILLGNFGSEMSEILKISSISSNTLNLASATGFAHPESTRVTILAYNRVIFFHTDTDTFSGTTNDLLTAANGIAIQPDSFFTIYQDTENTTGFGWSVFYNETTGIYSTNSNAIPYTDFAENSVKKILDSFFSLLNSKELKLISNTDAFRWLNEGYSYVQTELNLINNEYTSPEEYPISIIANTKEYDIPDGASQVTSVYNVDKKEKMSFIKLSNVASWDDSGSSEIKYYIRGNVIGFSPTPTDAFTVNIRYKQNKLGLTSYYQNITLPNNNYFLLLDYMMFRACQKLQNGKDKEYLKTFNDSLIRMKISDHKRDNHNDSWCITNSANI